jgi:phospholipid/cholesterol/gamma-HCH transport system ATP-binding protein
MLYDEPTTGLDPVMSDLIENLIMDMQKRYSHTNIIISHSVKSSFKLGDFIAFLYKGKILEYGTPEEIKKTENPILQQFLKGSSEGPIKLTGDVT